MTNTRRTTRDTQTSEELPITSEADTPGNQPPPTTGIQGANIPLTTTQGPEIPISIEGTNPLQMVIHGSNPQETAHQQPITTFPLLMNAPSGLQLHTTDLPQYATQTLGMPSYGMPPRPMAGGSGLNPTYHEAYVPSYIKGLGPQNLQTQTRRTPLIRDYSGPYTEDENDSTGEERDVAPRRRRSSQTNREQSQTTKERIATHEAEAARLKKLLAEEEAARTQRVPVINLDPTPRRTKRAEAPRGDPSILLPLGDLDDPTPPFTQDIMKATISRKFKMQTINAYDGTGDPANHVRTFSNALLLQPTNDAVKCRAFPQTLAGMAQRWYSRLPPNSIGSFKELNKAFINQFVSGRVHEKSSASLMGIQQGKNEALRDYINRFTQEALKVPDLEDKVAMIALQQGTTDDHFKRSLTKHPPESMLKLQDRARKYIKAEESMRKYEPTIGGNGNSKKRKETQEYDVKEKFPRTSMDSDSPPKGNNFGPKFTKYARLNTPRSQILMEIAKEEDLKWPKPMRADMSKRNQNQFCRFHKEVGHDTDDCWQLKVEIEFLIRTGKLNKFTKDGNQGSQRGNYERKDYDRRDNDQDRNPKPRGPVINMIFGGPTAAGSSRNSRKAYAREVMTVVGEAPKRARTEVSIGFDDSNLEGVKFPHDDPLGIIPVIGNSETKRVLVDNGASVDILFHDAFIKMGYIDSQLTPSNML
ncbi:hypothetical protein POM88_045515 [Heracleum sosnowskyi]|uniref:Retrotransposon gag domain-containing protein n=1 Tax=Heracleum sosnowskyi TaxID=360622 RepID=A0AAD8H623_9APIA|nr:hypothetical protein POM88_045515 [Heracleum sosnowskyi]